MINQQSLEFLTSSITKLTCSQSSQDHSNDTFGTWNSFPYTGFDLLHHNDPRPVFLRENAVLGPTAAAMVGASLAQLNGQKAKADAQYTSLQPCISGKVAPCPALAASYNFNHPC